MAPTTGDMLPEDTMKLLIATDVHLGYAENDPIRGEDSFNTFEEILNIGMKQEVDMIVLGGDLFHDNKPSPKCIHRCMALIRHYCMGNRPICVQFLSDQSENFQNAQVNYEDPNLNISIPIFSIHGNHDDPSGHGRISSLDILSASGLVNYFGRWNDLQAVNVSPLLMRKGETYLALFGLSHIPDDRLSRLFRSNKVNFFRPREQPDSWFNMFVLHQNRVNRGINKFIEDTMLPTFLDLVMWGHEHECLIHADWNSTQDFRITQPGSPVATSLCEGEAAPKHVGILKINKKKFHLQPIPLKTVRPFVMDTISLTKSRINLNSRNVSAEVQKYVEEYVDGLIERAANQQTGHEKQPILPLIRLRVEYSSEVQAFNTVRFGEKFHGKIANPDHLIRLMRERKEAEKSKKNVLDIETMQDLLKREPVSLMWENRIDAVLEEYFKNTSQSALQVLSVKGLSQAASRFITKDDKEAVTDIVKHQTKKILNYLEENSVNDDEISKAIDTFRSLRNSQGDDSETKDALQVLDDKNRLAKLFSQRRSTEDDEMEDVTVIEDNSDDDSMMMTVGRGRGRAQARGRGRGEGSSRARASANNTNGNVSRRGRGRSSRIKL
ncbi:hypothetical protein R5R35_010113 [Gryllus longicercus]|uniref:Double-strand break repair protein n=1 Tax=Gryllus longicercus TaxID=2509291 RepID=A0AAN9VNQ9_9ORTH